MSSHSHQNYTRRWAIETRTPVISIDYSLAPQHPFPQGLDDIWQAYVWTVEHIESQLGISPKRIVVAGDSAGGNFALALCFKAVEMGYRVPDGLLLAYPAVCLDKDRFTPSFIRALDDMVVPHTFLKLCLKSYLGDTTTEVKNPYVSPLYASDEQISALPPVRMLLATEDPLRDDSFRFVERLLNNGVDVKIKEYCHHTHGFLSFDVPGGIK